MKWFEAKEKSAGEKRLILSFYIYKFFGAFFVYIIAFFVSFFTLLFSKEIKFYSKKYFETINIKPDFFNMFKLVFSYAISLVDKMIVYSGSFKNEIIFQNQKDKEFLFSELSQKRGVCFLFSHIGNIEILHAFFKKQREFSKLSVNIFLSKKQTEIFNNFIEKIKVPTPAKYIIAEDFDITSAIKLKENLDKGEVLFIAGDRISAYNSSKTIQKTMFSKKINLPEGTFRLAKLLDVPIFFINVVKQKNKYVIYLKKHTKGDIAENYTKYSEGVILENPFQFYNFYDFFFD